MIWMLYYVVGFWVSFGLVILNSALTDERPDDIKTEEGSSALFAAVVVAMVWPVALPLMAVLKVNGMLDTRKAKPEAGREDKRAANHGYPIA